MSRTIIFALLAGIILLGVLFMRHLNLTYRDLIASTQKGEPLFERPLLEAYGQQIIDELSRQDVSLAIVSRSGQPRERLPEGILFTHSAFWLRGDDGEYRVYNLYHGEDNRLKSSLVVDTPADFLRLTREHDAGILLPTKDAQSALRDYILSSDYPRLHQENYSLISNPFDTRFQNCNEFMLDVLAGFAWGEYDASLRKAKLKGTISGSQIKAGFVRRHIAPFVDERLIMADHDGPIYTATRADLAAFLRSQNMLERDFILALDAPKAALTPHQ